MLRKFAVALVAASLIAGPALAQTGSAPPTAGHTAKMAIAPTVKKHVSHRHVAHKHVTRTHKHVAKHHAHKTHVSKIKHHKAVKRIRKPVDKTLG